MTWCQASNVRHLTRARMVLSTDEKASIYVAGKSCLGTRGRVVGQSLTLMNISEALAHNENFTEPAPAKRSSDKDGSLFWVGWLGGAIGGVAMLLIFIIAVVSKCSKRKIRGQQVPGDYGRASIDSNFQYGEKEYYQCQYAKKQTHVVDENDLYKNYDYE